MSNWKKNIFLLIVVVLLVGCTLDSPAATATPTPLYLQELENIFLPEYATLIEIDPDMYQIATPLVPSFIIWDGILISCLGQNYIVLDISNYGPWGFQFGWMHVTSNTQSFYSGGDETPFHDSGGECPVGNGNESLASGESSHLYIPVEYTFGVTTTFNIQVTLCSYLGNDSDPPFPDHSNYCPYREYTIIMLAFTFVYVEVLEAAPCLIGPDPLRYEVVSSEIPGAVVELLGNAKEPGWKVIRNTLYNVPCFFRADYLNFFDQEAADSKDDEYEPGKEKDISCPPGEKYNFLIGECVEKDTASKCSDYGDITTCGNNGCIWDTTANNNQGGCE